MREESAPFKISSQGFTLIELVVAFSIIAVLSTIGIASFVSYSRTQALQQAANDLIVTLNTAKSKSIAQVKPDDINCLPPSGNALLNGYQVVLNKTTNSYTLSAICNGTPDALSNATTKLYGITFDLSTFVPASATKMTVTFTILNGGVTSSNGNVNAQRATSILLKGATGVTPKTIIITAGGLIE